MTHRLPRFRGEQFDAILALADRWADDLAAAGSSARLANDVDMMFTATLRTYLDPEAPPDCLGKMELAPLAEAGIDLADMTTQEDVLDYIGRHVYFRWRTAEAGLN